MSAHTGAGPRPGSSATCRKPGSDSPCAPWCSLLQAGRLAGCLLLAVHNSPLVVFAVPGGRSLPAVRPLTFQGGRGKVLNPALGPQNRYPSPLACSYLRCLATYLLCLRRSRCCCCRPSLRRSAVALNLPASRRSAARSSTKPARTAPVLVAEPLACLERRRDVLREAHLRSRCAAEGRSRRAARWAFCFELRSESVVSHPFGTRSTPSWSAVAVP